MLFRSPADKFLQAGFFGDSRRCDTPETSFEMTLEHISKEHAVRSISLNELHFMRLFICWSFTGHGFLIHEWRPRPAQRLVNIQGREFEDHLEIFGNDSEISSRHNNHTSHWKSRATSSQFVKRLSLRFPEAFSVNFNFSFSDCRDRKSVV